MTIWLTGLSASGKTTLARRLKTDLTRSGFDNVELLDGEELRDRLKESGYSTEDRNALGLKKAQVALELNRAGKLCIVTGIAHHRQTRRKVREMFDRYMEVYLKCNPTICARRDGKGHYQKALTGEYENFVGVTEPYQESEKVELVLETDVRREEECAKELLQAVLERIGAERTLENVRDRGRG